MSHIKIITPPDKLYDRCSSIFLLYPSDAVKYQLQQILQELNEDYNIYVYDINTDEHNYEWLLDIHKMCNVCIIELDLLPHMLKTIESYLISFPNTFYITNGESQLYKMISNNRIFSLEEIKSIIGDYVKI